MAHLNVSEIFENKTFEYVIPGGRTTVVRYSWYSARQYCIALGGELASIGDSAEQKRVADAADGIGGGETFWIGANDIKRERHFEWSDGTRFSYTNWYPGEPNNKGSLGPEDCVHLRTLIDGRKWNDLHCTNRLAFICKIPVY